MVNPEVDTISNSRNARNILRETYGRYVLGKDRYPRLKVLSPIEEINPRVRPVAKLLAKEWATIDLDREYFWDMIASTEERLADAGRDAAGLVIAKIGRNAAQLGKVSISDGETHVMHGVFTLIETQELVNGADLVTADGQKIQYLDGDLIVPPLPDMVIVRNRPDGAASYFEGLTQAA